MKLWSEELALLNEIIGRRSAQLLPAVAHVGNTSSPTEELGALLAVLAAELEEFGLGRDGEPNAHGLHVDALMARLRRAAAKASAPSPASRWSASTARRADLPTPEADAR